MKNEQEQPMPHGFKEPEGKIEPQQELNERKPRDLKYHADFVMEEFSRSLDEGIRMMEVNERIQKERGGTFDTNYVIYKSGEVFAKFFLLKQLREDGVISTEEFEPLCEKLKILLAYEDKRLEDRANAYAGTEEDQDSRRQAILTGEGTLLGQYMMKYFKKQD